MRNMHIYIHTCCIAGRIAGAALRRSRPEPWNAPRRPYDGDGTAWPPRDLPSTSRPGMPAAAARMVQRRVLAWLQSPNQRPNTTSASGHPTLPPRRRPRRHRRSWSPGRMRIFPYRFASARSVFDPLGWVQGRSGGLEQKLEGWELKNQWGSAEDHKQRRYNEASTSTFSFTFTLNFFFFIFLSTHSAPLSRLFGKEEEEVKELREE